MKRKSPCHYYLMAAMLAAVSLFGQSRQSGQAMIAAHNRVRARVGVPPLVWSNRLAQAAQNWAGALAARNAFHPDPNSPFGENLFEIQNGQARPDQVVNAWASEARNYDYRTNTCRARCGHYTQLVWRDTKQVGCGEARRGNIEIWVCDYDPPGNFRGERPY
jgi:pathogenesis-related protein 1